MGKIKDCRDILRDTMPCGLCGFFSSREMFLPPLVTDVLCVLQFPDFVSLHSITGIVQFSNLDVFERHGKAAILQQDVACTVFAKTFFVFILALEHEDAECFTVPLEFKDPRRR